MRHFLDVTKSNLFFARGIILVEGWAEEILIPAIAQAIDKELSTKEISIINVGSTAFLHFARIFIPADDEKKMNYPVAIVTDLDVRPNENGTFDEESEARNSEMKKRFIDEDNNSHIKVCIAKQWTLEWCLFNSKSFRIPFMSAVERVHNRTKEFQKNTEGQWNEAEFKNKLIEMLLPNSNHKLDKVAVASELALSISTQHIIPEDDDMYIKYIIQAINHVCK